MNLILLGAPGSGKGTQGEFLEKKLGNIKISTGDLLREEIESQTEVGKQVQKLVSEGKFASNETVVDLVRKKISQNLKQGFMLDGFPRNIDQAEELEVILKGLSAKIDYVINFDVEDKEILRRIFGRFSCVNCKANYHKSSKMPKKEGVCDECGGTKFVTRKDDTEEVVRRRLEEYRKQTLPLVQYYEGKGVLINIDANDQIDKIQKKIESII
jgi:adenylate kinase